MMRKSSRQLIKKQPKCANCNLISNETTNYLRFSDYLKETKDDDENEQNSNDLPSTPLPLSHENSFQKITVVKDELITQNEKDSVAMGSKVKNITVIEALFQIFNWKSKSELYEITQDNKEKLFLCSTCSFILAELHDFYEKLKSRCNQSRSKSHLSPLYNSSSANKSSKRSVILSKHVKIKEETKEKETYLPQNWDENDEKHDPSNLPPAYNCQVILEKLDETNLFLKSEEKDEGQNIYEVKPNLKRNKALIKFSGPKRERSNKIGSHYASKIKSLTCLKCDVKFRSEKFLQSHIKKKHTLPICTFCNINLPTKMLLREHLDSFHDDKKIEECKECSKRFFTSAQLLRHSECHIDKVKHFCTICNSSFATLTLLKGHELRHTEQPNLPAFNCDQCNKRFHSLFLLQTHQKYLHLKKGAFKCEYEDCGKSFACYTKLETHMTAHSSTGTHLCEQCGKAYKHMKDLKIHEARKHGRGESTKNFPCGICDKAYYRADHLRLHRVSAKHFIGGVEPILPPPPPIVDPETLDKLHYCEVCNKSYVSESGLRTHQISHLENGEERGVTHKFTCSTCGVIYKTALRLERHVLYMHKLRDRYTCSYCEKTFGKISTFNRHLQTHSDARYICDVDNCDKMYKNHRDLLIHEKRDHFLSPKNYDFQCPQCPRRFIRRDMLRVHQSKTGHNPLPITTQIQVISNNIDTPLMHKITPFEGEVEEDEEEESEVQKGGEIDEYEEEEDVGEENEEKNQDFETGVYRGVEEEEEERVNDEASLSLVEHVVEEGIEEEGLEAGVENVYVIENGGDNNGGIRLYRQDSGGGLQVMTPSDLVQIQEFTLSDPENLNTLYFTQV